MARFPEFSDDFNYANKALDSGDWSRNFRAVGNDGHEAMIAESNEATGHPLTGDIWASYYNQPISVEDHYAQVDIIQWNEGPEATEVPYTGVLIRSHFVSPAPGILPTAYLALAKGPVDGNDAYYFITKHDTSRGTNSPIKVAGEYVPTVLPATMRIEAVGNVITIYVDDVLAVTYTDNDQPLDYLYTGILVGGTSSGGDGIVDNFESGRIEASGTTSISYINSASNEHVSGGETFNVHGTGLSATTGVDIAWGAGPATALTILDSGDTFVVCAAFDIHSTQCGTGQAIITVRHPDGDISANYTQLQATTNQIVTAATVDAVYGLAQAGGADGDLFETLLRTPGGSDLTLYDDTNILISPAVPNNTVVDHWRYDASTYTWDAGQFTINQDAAVGAYWSALFSLPIGIVGKDYDFSTWYFSTGDTPRDYTVSSGTLPSGIVYTQNNGMFSGYASIPIVADITLNVANVDNPGGDDTAELQIEIREVSISSPRHQDITATTAKIGCTTNSPRTEIYYICDADYGVPSGAQIVAGENSLGAPALASGSFTIADDGIQPLQDISGLALDNHYGYWFVQVTGSHVGAIVVGDYLNTIVGAQWTEDFAFPRGVSGSAYFYDTRQHADGNEPLYFITYADLPDGVTYENGILRITATAAPVDIEARFNVYNAEKPDGEWTAKKVIFTADVSADYFRMFQHLLPRARAWTLSTGSTIRDFFSGLGASVVEYKQFLDLIWLDLLPRSTRQLDLWGEQFGLLPNDITTETKRKRLDAAWQAMGGQGKDYIEGILQASGFDVYIHEWWVPGYEPPPNVHQALGPRDPFAVMVPPGYLLVNKLSYTSTDYTVVCGEPDAQCGEPDAQAGNFTGYLEQDYNYTLPQDAYYWHDIVYIGGETYGSFAAVDANRKDEFDELVLKLFPTQLWMVILVDFL